ncbi:tail fiber assembly protein [Escherichia coli]|nr:tail fiber assembly protein [Escherichia coli]
MNYWFSPENNAFYPVALKNDYLIAGTLPDDLIEVSDNVFMEYSGTPPEGKERGVAEDGYPIWVSLPPLTPEEEAEAAAQRKAVLLAEAQGAISIWQTELQLGIISEDDKASLISWLAYIKELQTVDTDAAPNINWPTAPAR